MEKFSIIKCPYCKCRKVDSLAIEKKYMVLKCKDCKTIYQVSGKNNDIEIISKNK